MEHAILILLNTISFPRTKKLVNNLLMSKIQWKGNLEHKLRTFGIAVLNPKWKDRNSRKSLCTEDFTARKNFTYM